MKNIVTTILSADRHASKVMFASAVVLALVLTGGTSATAQEPDAVDVAISNAPDNDMVVDLPAELASVEIPEVGANLQVNNTNSSSASIEFDVAGVAVLGISSAGGDSGLAHVEAQALKDDSARLLAVFDEPRNIHTAEFTLDLPDGFEAELGANGEVDIVAGPNMQAALDAAGGIGELTVATIDAPWARDADGKTVETAFQLDGDRLVQTVTPSADTTYPIVADPRVVWMGYYASLFYTKSETRDMRDSGVVIAGMLATAAGLAAFGPAGAAIGAAMFAIGAGAAGIIAATAANAVSDGRCLKVDVPSMYPSIVNC